MNDDDDDDCQNKTVFHSAPHDFHHASSKFECRYPKILSHSLSLPLSGGELPPKWKNCHCPNSQKAFMAKTTQIHAHLLYTSFSLITKTIIKIKQTPCLMIHELTISGPRGFLQNLEIENFQRKFIKLFEAIPLS